MSSGRAIVAWDTEANGGWKMEDVEVRKPGEGELLVDMVASGICHTDILTGGIPDGAAPLAFYPRVLGHEGGGYVKEVGPGVTVAKPGDAVLLSYAYCNECILCKSDGQSHCPRFSELNFFKIPGSDDIFTAPARTKEKIAGAFFGQSSFASLSIVKQTSVVRVTDLVKSKEELQLFSPLGCGIQTGSGTIINTVKPTPNDIVLIMGLGGVGLSAVMAAKIAGCRTIIGLDKVPSRLKLAEELGCTHIINGDELGDKSLVDAIRELSEDIGPNVVVDTTGAPPLIKAGYEAVRPKGKYVQVGSPPFDFEVQFSGFAAMLNGKQYLGAIEGQAYPPEYVPKMIQWYREGKFPIDKFFKMIKADDFQTGLKEMHDGTTIKPILCWS